MQRIVDEIIRRGRFVTKFAAAASLLALVSACGSDESLSPKTPRDVTEPTAPATQFGLSEAFDPYIFLLPTTDVGGAGDAPDQSDMNSFTRADNVTGKLGVAWTWDDINSWTGTGQTGDACALFDTDPTGTPASQGGGNADYAVCVRITNPDGDPTQIAQLPQPQSPVIYHCSDKKTDRCTTTFTVEPLGGSFCEVISTAETFPNPPSAGADGADILAACSIALSAIGNPSRTSLLNVCSFPSGSPNSNNFDCVVTPGSGFIQIKKVTTPQNSGQTFSFTLNPAASGGTTSFNILDNSANDETTALIPVAPGTYSITEISIPTGWALTNASCSGGTSTANPITGITVGVGETKTCTFTNALATPGVTVDKTANPTSIPETGGSVTYSVVVTNTASIAVTLTTLSDDKFGDLNGQGDCVTGGSIAAGGNYSCSFTKQLAPSTNGATHTNVVTATVSNAGGTANDTDDATVTYTDVAPTVTVDKSANPTTVLETGGSVTYTVLVTNTSSESVTLTTLTDDKFGNLDGQGTCDVTPAPTLTASGGTYSCSFSKSISGNSGTSHVNVVTATVQDNDGSSANDTDDATVAFSDVAPTVTVDKTANPTSLAETGGSVSYSVVVTNNSPESVTLTTLTDDKFGNLDGQGTCDVTPAPTLNASGGTYSCSFSKNISGNAGTSHVNVVTATVQDNDGSSANDTDDATVAFTDVAPTVTVDKSASTASVPETGGSVTYTVLVTNTSPEAVTLNSLTDDKFGNLDGQGTCDVTPPPTLTASGGTYSCSFSKNISGNAGTSHVNVVTATVQDNDGSSANDTDDATVAFSDVAPTVTVDKSANPTSLAETGGSVTYSVLVTNSAPEAVTLTTLTDDTFGNLDGQGTCDISPPPIIAASGGTYSCSFSKNISGNAGTSHVNVVTATVEDNDGSSANDTDDATVNFTNVNPLISVTKTANPTSLNTVQTGVLTFTADPGRTYTSNTTPTPGVPSFVSPTCDDGGANDINSSQVDLNCFNRADNVADRIHVKWTWDDINAWSGGGSTGDACALIDTDNDGNANVAVCARIQNDAQGGIVQIGGPDAVDVYVCNDTKTDRCAKQTTLLSNADNGDTKCNISTVGNGFPTGDDGADIEALCEIDRTMPGLPAITNFDLLNVCSFPSGEPNSNPFDCVVEIGAGFIQIIKVASPATSQQFGFTLSPAATDETDQFIVAGGVTSAAIPVAPGSGNSGYTLTETLPTNWAISTASCVVDGQSTGTFSLTNKQVTGITIKTGQTTVCTFTNTGLISGNVEYTIRVTNLGKEDVSLFSLVDDRFGDLNGVGNCVTGGTIAGSVAGNLYYECKFTKTLSGAAGTSHTNEVTAVARDDESTPNSDTKKASATVDFVSPP